MPLSTINFNACRDALTDYYLQHGRHDMVWRQPDDKGVFDPYAIMVSELMLQQTQVSRVVPKYNQFMRRFPSVQTLASAPLAEVLTTWSGLGYNRRAKFLWQAAQLVMTERNGVFPRTLDELIRLPGIGPNTAGAIMAYAYDAPTLFVETNIRTVIIHHFFADQEAVSDAAILDILTDVIPRIISHAGGGITTTRQCYWAMMDYGASLKKTVGNKNRASKTYHRQTAFHGSKRQVRGQMLRLLIAGPLSLAELEHHIADPRRNEIMTALIDEGLIRLEGSAVQLG